MGWILYFLGKDTVFLVRQGGDRCFDDIKSIHGVPAMRVFGKIVVGQSKS